MHRHDVRVVERTRDARLAQEARREGGIGRVERRELLQRDHAVEVGLGLAHRPGHLGRGLEGGEIHAGQPRIRPEQLHVEGYDADGPTGPRSCPGPADIIPPRPTLIAQPIEDMTRTAIAALLDQVGGESPPSGRRLLFPSRLVERDFPRAAESGGQPARIS